MPSSTNSDCTTVAPRMIEYCRAVRLWHLRIQCQLQEDRADRAALSWLHHTHRLTELKECARTAFFAQQLLELNEEFLKDIKNKLLHKSVKKVVYIQRKLARFEKQAEAAVKKEKKLDAEWWSEMQKHWEGN